jgi:ribosomal protein S18 acetylase RimI-like enzyme
MRKDLPFSTDARQTPLARVSFNDAGLRAVVEALNVGFADYVVPMRWSEDALTRRMDAESVDRAASFVYRAAGIPAGVCMMARRGRHSRVAAFCVSPALRRAGVGRRMVSDAVNAARTRGDARMSLEVIEQNGAAVAFYRALGFAGLRRLVGYRRAPRAGVPQPLLELPIAAMAEVTARYEGPDAQWQLAAATLRGLRAPARAYALGEQAYALVSGEREDGFDLRALVVPPEHRGAGWGARMVDALTFERGNKACNIAPIVPEGLARAFFAATGFAVQEISQLEMTLAP